MSPMRSPCGFDGSSTGCSVVWLIVVLLSQITQLYACTGPGAAVLSHIKIQNLAYIKLSPSRFFFENLIYCPPFLFCGAFRRENLYKKAHGLKYLMRLVNILSSINLRC